MNIPNNINLILSQLEISEKSISHLSFTKKEEFFCKLLELQKLKEEYQQKCSPNSSTTEYIHTAYLFAISEKEKRIKELI